jgi:hypothetical protein
VKFAGGVMPPGKVTVVLEVCPLDAGAGVPAAAAQPEGVEVPPLPIPNRLM